METGSSATLSGAFTFTMTSPAPILVAVLSVFKASVARSWLGLLVGTKAVSLEC